MENTALTIAMMGIIIFLLLVLIYALSRQKKHLKETGYPENTQNANTLDNMITHFKNENEKLNNIIAEQKQEIANIKNENTEFNRILKNYEKNIPTIFKIKKDNSDLLFFYREFIHKIAYINPMHIYIKTFGEDINQIDKNLSTENFVDAFKKCLDKIEISNKEEKLTDYAKMIAGILYASIYDIDEKSPDADNEQNKIFHKIYNCTAEIIEAKKADIETIETLRNNLVEYYPKWKSILTRPWFMNFLIGAWKGIKETIISQTYGVFGDVLNKWEEINKLQDEDFVNLYNGTIGKIIEVSFNLARTIDIDFTAIEILYQKHIEEENTSLFKEIQTSLVSGKDLDNLYSALRKARHNKMLKDIPEFEENIIKELQTKNLGKETIANIREIVC